jgi:uncharacterized repeat protein (TIGR03803 family)
MQLAVESAVRESGVQVARRARRVAQSHVELMEGRVLLSAYAMSQRGSFGFTEPDGSNPMSTLVADASGNLFGTTRSGGPGNDGTVFELPKGASTMTTLAAFNGANGQGPEGGVVLDSSGNFYGTTYSGGTYGDGTVFEVASGSDTITTLLSFNGAIGSHPGLGLTIDASGNLYGATNTGGVFNDGTIFEIASGSMALTTIASFNGTNGSSPSAVTLGASGDIYGTTPIGGSKQDGTVFEIANGSSTITTLAAFIGSNGSDPGDRVALDAAGNLYGVAASGGASGDGTIFELAQGSGTITTLVSFDGSAEFSSQGGVALDASGNVYGITRIANDAVFEVDHASHAVTLIPFNGYMDPQADLAFDGAGNLYGTTANGGPSQTGTLFEIGAGSQRMTTLASFRPDDGSQLHSPVTLDPSGNLYGTTYAGGSNGAGTVFEIPAGSTMVTTLASFNGGNGMFPQGGVTMDAAGNLYGTTEKGGWGGTGDGTVFEVAKGSNTITTIGTFNGTNGEYPFAGVTMDASGNLYGTTELGGAIADGTVFEIAKGSATVTVLASFNGTNGSKPLAGVTLDASGNLYGTTSVGGANGDGTVFEIAQGLGTITTLASFNGANGADPKGGVTLDPAGNLYGTTSATGANNTGTVFEIANGTSTITTLVAFNWSTNGQYVPDAGLTLDAAGNLFGTTTNAPAAGGTLFEIAKGSSTITTLAHVADPEAGVTLDESGNIYGTTNQGGIDNQGSVLELAVMPNPVVTLTPLAVPNPSNPLQGSLTFRASISGGVPDGETVTLVDSSNGNAVLATGKLSGGTATLSFLAKTLLAGKHDLIAVYGADANLAAGESAPYTQVAQAAVTSVVVNGNNPALAGVQRSMVNSIVYTFSQAVTLAATNAFIIGVHAGQTGTAPTLAWSAINPDANGGSTQWVVTFSGAGVAGGSIANGVYDITLDMTKVTIEGNASGTVLSRPTDTFYRLFGDINGDRVVNVSDEFQFSKAMNSYNPAFDFNGDGTVNLADEFQASKSFSSGGFLSGGFVPTI